MTNEKIKQIVLSVVDKYSISKVVLFGSRASHTNNQDSDVDVIHGPITEDDMIEFSDEVILYAA